MGRGRELFLGARSLCLKEVAKAKIRCRREPQVHAGPFGRAIEENIQPNLTKSNVQRGEWERICSREFQREPQVRAG